MGTEDAQHKLSVKREKRRSGELLVLIHFFIFSMFIFWGSFSYKFEARAVPMFIGFITMILSGARLFTVILKRSPKEMVGIGGDFDKIKDELQAELFEDRIQEEEKEITWRDEIKGFLLLAMNFLSIFLFGYWIGIFLAFTGSAWLYRFKEIKSIFWMLLSAYIFGYLICYKMMGFQLYKGILLEWIWG